ncbi:MAG: hypothetical protein WAM11_02905, partial [Cyanobium sp.]
RDLSPQGRLNDAVPSDQALTTTGSLRKSSIRDLKEPGLSGSPDYSIPRLSHAHVTRMLLLSASERHDENTLSRSPAWARTTHGTPPFPNPEL